MTTTYWQVYLCGATDCFLHFVSPSFNEAALWLKNHLEKYPVQEGVYISSLECLEELDFTDTGVDAPIHSQQTFGCIPKKKSRMKICLKDTFRHIVGEVRDNYEIKVNGQTVFQDLNLNPCLDFLVNKLEKSIQLY